MITVNVKNQKVLINNSLLESEIKSNISIDLFDERTMTKKSFLLF